ncbi:MAG: hypothetical protein IT177_02505 [Acidobacteria bacterium]|nr:hypothetical protein [Acidobacteriota bacterium]
MSPKSLAAVLVLAAALAVGASVEAHRTPALTVDEQLAFLKTARVVNARPIGKGVTGALRLTLTDGVVTHDASFQSVDDRARPHEVSQGKRFAGELLFVDSYRYNVAAWELARLLGLEAMMPPTVERYYRGEPGAFSWWVDEVMMDEGERERTNTQPAGMDAVRVGRQRQQMQVFAELVRDTDRNKGNVLYTKGWQLVMLDFTRAFRLRPELRLPQALTTCDRDLLDRLRALHKQDVSRAAGRHLTPFEIDALMKRRDLIVERFDRLVAERGASAVLF